jgi:hypothetical protein
MPDLLLISLVPLFGAFGLGAVDGIYFHLNRYRLFAHPESRGEHALHTVRSVLVLPTLALLFLADPSGVYLWLAAACVALDQSVLFLDLRVEARSRSRFGGLSAAEYQVHVLANGMHGIAVALALGSRPADAWSAGPSVLACSTLPRGAQILVGALLLAATVAAVQHIALLFSERRALASANPTAMEGLTAKGGIP